MQPTIELAAVTFAVERQSLLRRQVELAKVGDQEEAMQQQVIGTLFHYQHHAAWRRPGTSLVLQVMAPLARLLGSIRGDSYRLRAKRKAGLIKPNSIHHDEQVVRR